MKKKIRYSELAVPQPQPLTKFTPKSSPVIPPPPANRPAAPSAESAAVPATVASSAATSAAAPAPVDAASNPPRTRRSSSPVNLAGALAKARAAEARQAAETLSHVEARAAAAHARELAASEARAAEERAQREEREREAQQQREQVEQQESQEQPAARQSRWNDDDDEAVPTGPRRPLRERARSRSGIAELLMFRIGNERFAVELMCVEEAIDLPEVHHVPEMPPAMLGVVTVRGALTPVYTPDSALGVPVEGRAAALIFRADRGRFALAIDDVDDVMTLDLAQLRDAPGIEGADSVVLGVARNGSVIVALVDAEALMLTCQAIPALELA